MKYLKEFKENLMTISNIFVRQLIRKLFHERLNINQVSTKKYAAL